MAFVYICTLCLSTTDLCSWLMMAYIQVEHTCYAPQHVCNAPCSSIAYDWYLILRDVSGRFVNLHLSYVNRLIGTLSLCIGEGEGYLMWLLRYAWFCSFLHLLASSVFRTWMVNVFIEYINQCLKSCMNENAFSCFSDTPDNWIFVIPYTQHNMRVRTPYRKIHSKIIQ